MGGRGFSFAKVLGKMSLLSVIVLTEIFLFCGPNAPLSGHHKNEGKKKGKNCLGALNSHESCEKKSN
jgi:hypothetical protein